MIARVRSFVRLVRWLGPWSDEDKVPKVGRSTLRLEGPRGVLRAEVFRPLTGPLKATYIVAPGLHHSGPADPRMERFCSVLAHAGFEVRVPYIPSFLSQVLTPEAIEDFNAVVAHAIADGRQVCLFSISFGSLLALRAAADTSLRDGVASVVVFGGYADLGDAVDFCMSGHINGEQVSGYDPLNLPVLFLNTMDVLEGMPADVDALADAWRLYMRSTWGVAEIREESRYLEVGSAISRTLPAELRPMFEMGVGLDPSGLDLLRASRHDKDWSFLDPRPHFETINCPVHLIHGADDDVIPFTQAYLLEEAMPAHVSAQVYLTGMYGHTRKEGAVEGLYGEVRTMLRMLRVLANPLTPSKRSSTDVV